MVTDAGWVDFMAQPPGAAPYPQLQNRSVRRRVRNIEIPIVGLDGPATILFLITPGHLDDFFRLRERAVDTAQVADLQRRFL